MQAPSSALQKCTRDGSKKSRNASVQRVHEAFPEIRVLCMFAKEEQLGCQVTSPNGWFVIDFTDQFQIVV